MPPEAQAEIVHGQPPVGALDGGKRMLGHWAVGHLGGEADGEHMARSSNASPPGRPALTLALDEAM